jgi:phage portal protein BeeE
MNLFGLNITVDRKSPARRDENRKSIDPSLQAWLRGENITDQTGPTLTNAYQQVVWVYRAINVLAEQVANIPFLFSHGERGRENLITSGPLLDFYAHPHPRINRFQYWELRIMWLMLRGECFRLPIFGDSSSSSGLSSSSFSSSSSGLGKSFSSSSSSGLGSSSFSPSSSCLGSDSTVQRFNNSTSGSRRRLKSVQYLDPAAMRHIIEDHELVGWQYTGGGGNQSPIPSQVFLPEEVWFERLPNPFDPWRGMPPLAVVDLPARTDHAASSFMRGLMENNADTGLIVRSDNQLGPEQREQVLAALRNRKRKAGTADRPIFLWGVNEIVKPELSSADMQFLENRKFTRSEICAAFGVPEEVLTSTDKAKYDVMAGARLNFLQNRVVPLCARLEAEEEVTVKAIDPSAIGWFDVDAVPLMQEALKTRLIAAKAGFDMGIPFNLLNREFDLGFPSFPWGNTGYLPAKLQPVGTLAEAAAAPKHLSEGGPSKLNPVGTFDDKSSSSSFSSSSSKPHSQKL